MASKEELKRAGGANLFFSNSYESMKKQEEKPVLKKSEKREQEIEKFLEQLRLGKNQKEASEAVGHDKTWGSRVVAELKEKDPARLKGTLQEVRPEEKSSQDVTQTAQETQRATKTEQAVKNTNVEEKAKERANTKPQKQVFSFRASKEHISDWKAYATAAGLTMENMGTVAMNEYLTRHKLDGSEKAIYDALKAKGKM